MAIIFFGTPDFAVHSLRALLDAGEDVRLVVTQPDRVKGRGHALSMPPVKELALERGIRVLQPEKIRTPEFHAELSSISPEFIIVVAYGRILPKAILDIPERGCINVHASLLPKYRGAAPIQWSIIRGETVTGVTTMMMDEGLDTGDMLIQRAMDIAADDNSATLFNRLALLGAETLADTLQGLREGTVKRVPQAGEPSFAPTLKKEDGRIEWSRPAKELSDFIRGVTPWPTAMCRFGTENIKVIKAGLLDGKAEPGLIIRASGGILAVGTGNGLLQIEELQPEGKRAMPASAFLAGRRLREGYDKFD